MKTALIAINARYTHSSLALRYLEKYNAGFDISVYEFSINDNIGGIYRKLLRCGADAYCFSCYIWNIELTLKIASALKLAAPECKIILGGPESGYNAASLLKIYDFIDCILKGEGEELLGRVLSRLERGEEIERFYAQEYPLDLSKIPMPYTEKDISDLGGKIIYFETSRGCPFGCSYCLSSAERGVRFFPMEYVKSGLDMFFRLGVPLVKFVDRTFNIDEDRAVEIVEYIVKNSTETSVHFEIEAEIMTPRLIDTLNAAPDGLFQLEIGIQTTNPDSLRAVNRKCDVERTRENILRLIKPGNIHVHLDLIAGLPFEDYESFRRSFNYAYSMRPNMLQLGFLKVLPGTEIAETSGIRSADFPPYEVVSTDWIDARSLASLKETEEALDLFYNGGAFKRTIEKLTDTEDPFGVFEELGGYLAKIQENGKIKRAELYNKLYEKYSDSIENELILDFLEFNRNIPLPPFAKRELSKDFKKKYTEALKSEAFKEKYDIGDDLSVLRFERVDGRVYMVDYSKPRVYEISKEFMAEQHSD